MFKSGFVTIIGRPNVGKSTLLNKVIGEKLSIVSNKPQTTRNKIQLIYSDIDSQIIFLDTPGIQDPKNKLGTYMLNVSESTLNEVDIITYIVDCSEKIGRIDSYIIEQLQSMKLNTPIILLINKTDTIKKENLLPIIEMYKNTGLFKEIIPISALMDDNIGEYIKTLKENLSEGPKYFPDDMITDQPEKFIVAEIIREKALNLLEEEVPHGVFVRVESMKERKNKDLIDVEANLFVEKESHKGIVIGKKGSMLKQIGIDARKDIELLLDSKINLQIWVKVEKNWRDNDSKVKYFGYR